MVLPILKNVIWTPKRAGTAIVFATVSELRTIVAQDAPLNFVWPTEGSFLKLQGSEDTFKMDENNDTLPPLVVSPKDAARILKLYDESKVGDNRDKLERMVSASRGNFARVFDASVAYESV